MNLKVNFYYLTILFVTIIGISCSSGDSDFLGDFQILPYECDGIWQEQLHSFGNYTINIDTPRDTLTVGDSIRFRIQMPPALYDSISLEEIVIEEIEIKFFVTRDTEEEKDTSLIYIFDQYFDISVVKGELFDPYHFKFEKDSSGFQLDFYYVCKKELKYYIPIRFYRIVVKDVDTNCMFGDTDTWDASISVESEFNTIQNQDELSNYFGFIVR